MAKNLNSIACQLIILPLTFGLLFNRQLFQQQPDSAEEIDTACRFGITSVLGSEGYDIAGLGVGSYLDWEVQTDPSLPEGVEYIHVLRVREDLYSQTLANLPEWVKQYPESVWVVGNEPDTYYEGQDGLLAEVYADRFYELARIIRKEDPTARIAFGSIVQPTPLRLRYLEHAWERLVTLAGSPSTAAKLIDIWSIHSFILNEQMGRWGAGIPPGFEYDSFDAVVITDLADTYSIDIFQSRILAFRNWLASKGMRDKPVWITEYGSLLPPIDPPGGPDYYNVSDEDTAAFMLATFDFLLTASDSQTGLPGDGNRLVQRWFWYSLNGHRYTFGGTLYDPDNGKLPTWVGQQYIEFQANHLDVPDLYPSALTIAPVSYNFDRTRVNYRLDVAVANSQFQDASCARVWIYDGDPANGGILISGPLPASMIRSDNGQGRLTANWRDVEPLTDHQIFVYVEPVGIADSNPSNNLAGFYVFTELPKLSFLPVVNR